MVQFRTIGPSNVLSVKNVSDYQLTCKTICGYTVEKNPTNVEKTSHRPQLKNQDHYSARVDPQVAQARNMSIGEQRHCCVTFKI